MKKDRKSDRKKKVAIGIIIIILVVIVAYLYFSGGSTEAEEVNSVDIEVEGDTNLGFSGEYRMRARGLQKEKPDVRLDITSGKPAMTIWIYNSEEGELYGYNSDDDYWVNLSEMPDLEYLQEFAKSMRDYVSSGEGDMTVEYQGSKYELRINEVNPSLPDSLFTPPEDAKMENLVPKNL